MQNGVTLAHVLSIESCAVPCCKGHAEAQLLFCKSCWLALPKRSRRRFWREFRQDGRFSLGLYWRLIAHRLANKVEWLTWECERYEAQAQLHRELELLSRLGVNVETINRMALKIQELEGQLQGPFTR